jgi:uncharacterized DUF497 family protein
LSQRYFWWDEINIEHIADHGIEPFEAEEAVDNRPLIMRAGEGKYIAYGQTDAGRYLVVVFALKDEQRLRVITARDMTQAEKRKVRGKRK